MADDDTTVTQEQIDEAVAKARKEWEAEVAGLKANKDDVLKEKKALEKRVKVWEELGLDPEEIQTLKAEAEERAAKKAKDEGDWEKREQQLKEHHAKELAKREEREKQLLSALDNEVRTSKAVAALSKHVSGENVELLLPHVLSSTRVVEKDGVFTAIVPDPERDGAPKLMPDPDNSQNLVPMTIEALVEGMKKKYPSAFPGDGTKGSGGTSSERVGAGGAKTVIGVDGPLNLTPDQIHGLATGNIKVDSLPK